MSKPELKIMSIEEINAAGYEIKWRSGIFPDAHWSLYAPDGREIIFSATRDECMRQASVGASRPLISDLGCVLGSQRGHYLARDIIDLAVSYGFIVGPSDAYVVAAYEDHWSDDDYPFEVVQELSDEAIEWLNVGDNSGLGRPLQGQNSPPRVPKGAVWFVEDGELYLAYPDTSEDDCTEHGFDSCPDCGNGGIVVGKSGYEHCTRFLSCWSDSRVVNVDAEIPPEFSDARELEN